MGAAAASGSLEFSEVLRRSTPPTPVFLSKLTSYLPYEGQLKPIRSAINDIRDNSSIFYNYEVLTLL
jgi:hypothetical protein